MGKDLKGRELGKGISQEKNGLYSARYVDKLGTRRHKRFKKLQECRKWIADSTYINEHSDISAPAEMLVDSWFEYWISIKKKTVRYNTCLLYTSAPVLFLGGKGKRKVCRACRGSILKWC